MKDAGVDTSVYQAHSCRHAATTAANIQGVSLDTIIKSASWSNDSTFFRFYKKDISDGYELSHVNFGQEILDNFCRWIIMQNIFVNFIKYCVTFYRIPKKMGFFVSHDYHFQIFRCHFYGNRKGYDMEWENLMKVLPEMDFLFHEYPCRSRGNDCPSFSHPHFLSCADNLGFIYSFQSRIS